MKVDINVKITEKDLNSFMLYHNYAGFQGKLSIVLGILAIIASVSTYGKVDTIYTIAYVAFGIILIVYTPVSIKMRSKKQFLLTPVFKEPIHYTIDEEGIQRFRKDFFIYFPASCEVKGIHRFDPDNCNAVSPYPCGSSGRP